MANYWAQSIEQIIRQAMSDDTSAALDSYLIDNVAASTGVRPAGLLNGVTPITASAASTPAAKMVADLNALAAAIEAAGGGRNIIYIMNPAQAGFLERHINDRRFHIRRSRIGGCQIWRSVDCVGDCSGRKSDRYRCGRFRYGARRRASIRRIHGCDATRGRYDAASSGNWHAGFRRSRCADAVAVPNRCGRRAYVALCNLGNAAYRDGSGHHGCRLVGDTHGRRNQTG